MHLAGKVALVTGASRGIGREIALALAAAGADVACVATRAAHAEDTAGRVRALGRRAVALGARVEEAAAVASMFAEATAALGPVDVLMNNAGFAEPRPVLEMDEANWDTQMDVNCKSVFLCSRLAARQMRERGSGGVIVNNGSIAGINAFPKRLAYCAAKAALHHMTRVMAIEWATLGIRVNCVAPGFIETGNIQRLARLGLLDEEALVRRIPQRRVGRAEDIGQAVVYLCSEEARYVTGSVLVVDGGFLAYGFV